MEKGKSRSERIAQLATAITKTVSTRHQIRVASGWDFTTQATDPVADPLLSKAITNEAARSAMSGQEH